jgi:hypothetical protein
MPHDGAQRWWSAKIIWFFFFLITSQNHLVGSAQRWWSAKIIWLALMKDTIMVILPLDLIMEGTTGCLVPPNVTDFFFV